MQLHKHNQITTQSCPDEPKIFMEFIFCIASKKI